MRQWKHLPALAVCGLWWSVAPLAQAQPDPHNPPKAANPPSKRVNPEGKRAQRVAGLKAAGNPERLAAQEFERLETLLGKSLTAEQKQAVTQAVRERSEALQAANLKYHDSLAKAVGLTVEQMAAKKRTLNQARKGDVVAGDAAAKPRKQRGALPDPAANAGG